MKTQHRDDAIERNKQTVRVLTMACLAQSVAILALGGLSLYAFTAHEIVYQPTLGGVSYTLSQRRFSPAYLQAQASNIMQLRLTWNPTTIEPQYQQLMSMAAPQALQTIRPLLNAEIKTVKKRAMRSVFYQTRVIVDPKQQLAQVFGTLERIDDGVVLPAVKKAYWVSFDYRSGSLQIVSIKEENPHAEN